MHSKNPYVSATLEEILRCASTAPSAQRRTLVDAEVLGHHIPAGTDVFMLNNGAGYVSAPLEADEKLRSQTSRESKDKNGEWGTSNIGSFMPERWLVEKEEGQLEFDARAGPSLPFGSGPRGCFGRKLALLELKIIVTLVIWRFKLLPTPPALSSFQAQDKLTHQPRQCYLRLTEAK